MARRIVTLRAPDGRLVGTAEIDTADGEPLVLQGDKGVVYVLEPSGVAYVEAIPVAVLVTPTGQ